MNRPDQIVATHMKSDLKHRAMVLRDLAQAMGAGFVHSIERESLIEIADAADAEARANERRERAA